MSLERAIAFLAQSEAARDKEIADRAEARQRELRRLRTFVFVLAVVVVGTVALAAFAIVQMRAADEQRKLALLQKIQVQGALARLFATKDLLNAEERLAKLQSFRAERQAKRALAASGEAELQRKEAYREKLSADEQAHKAGESSRDAQRQRAAAEREKQIADREASRAVAASRRATLQSKQALTRQLVAQALGGVNSLPQQSLLLAAESVRLARDAGIFTSSEAAKLLHTLLAATGGVPLLGHTGGVSTIAFSPDGRLVVTGGTDGTARIWDASHPLEAPIVLTGHTGAIASLSFCNDGRWLATAGADGTVRLWDPNRHRAPVVLSSHHGRVNAVAFTADSRWLASGTQDGTVDVWDMNASDPSATPVVLGGGQHKAVSSVAFSRSGRRLATVSADDNALRLWDTSELGQSRAATPVLHYKRDTPTGNRDIFTGLVAFSPDERRLAVSFGAKVELWDLTAADPSAKPVFTGEHSGWIGMIGFSPDGHWLATTATDAEVKLWDLNAPDPAAQPHILLGHQASVGLIAFDSKSRWLATAGNDRTVRVWDLANFDRPPVVLVGHEGPITAIAFSSDGYQLASAATDAQARLWQIPEPSPDRVVLHGQTKRVLSLGFSRDGQRLLSGSADETAREWKVANLQRAPLHLQEKAGPVDGASFSPGGHWLATASSATDSIQLWRLGTEDTEKPQVLKQPTDMTNLAFSPDDRWLVTTSWGGSVSLWKLDAERLTKEQPNFLCRELEPVHTIAFSADGAVMATGSHGYTARLWKLAGSNPCQNPVVITAGSVVYDVALSRDGHWLATTSWEPDRSAKLWRVGDTPVPQPLATLQFKDRGIAVAFSSDGHWLGAVGRDWTAVDLLDVTHPTNPPINLLGHQNWVQDLAFSPDGESLATMSEDKTIRLWNISRPNTEPVTLFYAGGVSAIAYSPDGRWLAAGSYDGTVRLWWLQVNDLVDLACRTAGRNLTAREWRTFFGAAPQHQTCPDITSSTSASSSQ